LIRNLKLKFCFNNFQPTNSHCQWHGIPPITSGRTRTGHLILHKGQPLFFSTTRSHSPIPFNSHVHISFKKSKHTIQRSLRPLMGDQKIKELVEIFMVDLRILYVLVVKISDLFYLIWNLCVISKVALVVFVWLVWLVVFSSLISTLMMISFGFKLHSQNKLY
jgi:hypothetical protein